MTTAPDNDHKLQAVSCEPPAVSDYEILALAGRGAFGSVWVARDHTGVLHALKVVDVARFPSPDNGDREEEALRLVRQRVPEHAHLVRISHVSRRDGKLIYSMELADPASGSPPPHQPGYRPDTLAGRLLLNQRLPVPDAIRLALDLLSALEMLHAAQLVHRDVKPHNVIFVGGVPKLADIGLTALARTSLSVAGTPGYLPLDGSTGPDADLFALGKLLYQCVTGLEPADFPAIPAHLLVGPEAKLIRRLNHVLLRACASAKKDRFHDTGQLRDALRGVLSPRPRLTPMRVVAGGTVVLALALAAWGLAGRRPAPAPPAAPDETIPPAIEAAKPAVPAISPAPPVETPRLPASEAKVAPLRTPPAIRPPRTASAVDAAFLQAVKGMPPQAQAQAVARKLKACNPQLTGQMKASVRAGKVVAVKIPPAGLQDLSPLRALPDLTILDCCSLTENQQGQITDLASLQGVRLTILGVAGNQVTDLAPLKDMPLEQLDCSANAVQSLEPLRRLRLKRLLCHNNRIADLSPLADQPLSVLNCGGNPVEDWTPLARLPLTELYACHTSIHDFSVLKAAQLGVVRCEKSRVTDLGPLAGMPLYSLDCGDTRVTSVEPLRKTPLRLLTICNTLIDDLSPLAGLRLEEIALTGSKVRDLTPLKGMPLLVIDLDFDAQRDGPFLRSFPKLKQINGRPRTEVLP